MADQLTPTSAAKWGKKRPIEPVPVKLPSDNVALCRRTGLEMFIKMGLIPNSLMSIVTKHMAKAQKNKKIDESQLDKELSKLVEDPEKLADMMDMVDRVTVHIVVEPEIEAVPGKGEARDPDKLYVDQVDFDDKMFLFQWASGGLESVESFREATGPAVVPVLDGAGDVDPAERVS